MTTATRVKCSNCRRGEHVRCLAPNADCQCVCRPAAVPKVTAAQDRAKAAGRKGGRTTQARNRERVAAGAAAGTRVTRRPMIAKEDAPCCAATRDEFGRYCVGFCSPGCIRRPS